jgi:cytochrome c
MGVRALLSAGLALLVMTSGVVSARDSAAKTTPEVFQKTTKDGIYTKAQADRAAENYAKVCANCHDPAKVPEGKKPAPPLVGDLFFDSWKGRTVGEMLAVIRLTMPNDGTMTLTAEEAADFTAYILQMNKFPEGKEELKNDDVAKKTVFVKGQ